LSAVAPNQPAAATASAGGAYAVQLSSQRSQAEAEATFRVLQNRYPNLLGGRQPIIRRVDLGERGTFYRAMVGPFANSEQASELCNALKAAGGQCFIQRN
jgi:cell division septation protein DedD